jgi:hypothetical protein
MIDAGWHSCGFSACCQKNMQKYIRMMVFFAETGWMYRGAPGSKNFMVLQG